MSAPTFTEDDFIEAQWVEGSGYGWAIVETRKPGRVAVLLINEEAEVLGVLRQFQGASSSLDRFLGFVTRSIDFGRGEALQRILDRRDGRALRSTEDARL